VRKGFCLNLFLMIYVLLQELVKDPQPLLYPIINALAVCGRINAVEKLFKLGKNSLNPFTQRRVKEAILRIQSRLGAVEKGWLSLSQLEEMEGALSLADLAGKGALSSPEISDTKKDQEKISRGNL